MDNTNTQSTPPTEQMAQPQPAVSPTAPPPTDPIPSASAPITPEHKSSKMLFIILVVVLLLAVAGVAAWMMMPKPSTTSDEILTVSQPTATPTQTETEEVDAVNTDEDFTQDFADVEKDVSSLE